MPSILFADAPSQRRTHTAPREGVIQSHVVWPRGWVVLGTASLKTSPSDVIRTNQRSESPLCRGRESDFGRVTRGTVLISACSLTTPLAVRPESSKVAWSLKMPLTISPLTPLMELLPDRMPPVMTNPVASP